jgi:hypothetical protein
VAANLASYEVLVPTTAEAPEWGDYTFTDVNGISDRVSVIERLPWGLRDLDGKFRGFGGYSAVYDVVSNARRTAAGGDVPAAVWQQVQVVAIPIFAFSYFYGVDLELHPWHPWVVPGRVHCNGSCYLKPTTPNGSLIFEKQVSASGVITNDDHPLDPEYRTSSGSITYQQGKLENSFALKLLSTEIDPRGTNEHKILELPPVSGTTDPLLEKIRYSNNAKLIISVTSTGVNWSIGRDAVNRFPPGPMKTNDVRYYTNFLSPNLYASNFYDLREGSVRVGGNVFDAGAFYSGGHEAYLRSNYMAGEPIDSIYISDSRPGFNALRIENGSTLLTSNLTIATPNPLYVKGDFNTDNKVVALASDAITILSSDWDDANSQGSLSARRAVTTTVNAAIITGIVPTGVYGGTAESSGWIANVFRLLEDWSSRTLSWDGSLCVLFASQQATNPWQGTYYRAPTRVFTNTLYVNPTEMPANTPSVRMMVRSRWEMLQPGASPP